ncbi:MAG: 4-hydroxy-tetrahydrodipicolinate synthase [Caldiserica bacterium]|nr:MAG: 4-hydroxy-tetrahydrodipicolinate synthase [Caldisericota bacterium]
MKDVDFSGCWTALVTPMKEDGSVDWEGFEKNIEFQISQGITGILPVGTTGESPTLSYDEHNEVIKRAIKIAKGRCFVLAGTGANSVKEAEEFTEEAVKNGADCCLLVDPYYNGPSSLEIRKEYYEYIAGKFPEMYFVPYVIPGRTGCALSPEDLAILGENFKNIRAVKEATGDLDRMRKEREILPDDFNILSGDDDKTFAMMTDDGIKATGVVSVISNIMPGFVQDMTRLILKGNINEAEGLKNKLSPFFKMVTIKGERKVIIKGKEYVVVDKYRNPLGIKTIMNIFGMPAGVCRRPLGKMQKDVLENLVNNLKEIYGKNPELFEPIEKFYGVNIEERLNDKSILDRLSY